MSLLLFPDEWSGYNHAIFLHRGHDNVVLIGMAGQSGVVGLDVELEMLIQSVLFQETDHTHSICGEKQYTVYY